MNQCDLKTSGLRRNLLPILVIGACVAALSRAHAEPPSQSIKAERDGLIGIWTGASYDFDGTADKKLKKGEYILMEFELPNGTPADEVYLKLKFSGIKGLPFNHSAGIGLNRACNWTLTQEESFSLATSDEGENKTPRFFIYELRDDVLDVMLAFDGTEKKTLTTEKGDSKAVFHLKRKKPAQSEKGKSSSATNEVQVGKRAGTEASLDINVLYGEWQGISYERNGMPPQHFGKKQRSALTINESVESFELVLSDMQREKMSGSSAHAIDMTTVPMKFYRVTGREQPERHLIAIFDLRGDNLTWCWLSEKDVDGEEAHLALITHKGDQRTIIHYNRSKKVP